MGFAALSKLKPPPSMGGAIGPSGAFGGKGLGAAGAGGRGGIIILGGGGLDLAGTGLKVARESMEMSLTTESLSSLYVRCIDDRPNFGSESSSSLEQNTDISYMRAER